MAQHPSYRFEQRLAAGLILLAPGTAFGTMGPRILLLLSAVPELLGRWVLPKGGVEQGEGEEPAALRELLEETGIPTQQVVVAPPMLREGGMPLLLGLTEWVPFPRRDTVAFQRTRYFLAIYGGDPSVVRTTEAHRGHAWVPLHEALSAPWERWAYAHLVLAFTNLKWWLVEEGLSDRDDGWIMERLDAGAPPTPASSE